MKRLICALALLIPCFAFSQIVLEVDQTSDECVEVLLNSTLDFVRGGSCSTDVVILDSDNFEVFRSNEQEFSFRFDERGTFTIFCGAGPNAVAMRSLCVEATVVPTLSEWSIICLMLVLMIFGVISIRQKSILIQPQLQGL